MSVGILDNSLKFYLTEANKNGVTIDSLFSHLAVEVPAEGASNEWLEPVSDSDYNILK